MRRIGRFVARCVRGIVWLHILLVLLAFFYGVFYSLFPPTISSLQLYRRCFDGIKPVAVSKFVPLKKLHPHLPEMLIAAEDGNFWQHRGIDIESMKQAWAVNKQLGYYHSGASTITQQLARTLFLFPEKWLVRKYAEIWISLTLELVVPKERLIELYVNSVEWGRGIYGIDAASRIHFGKPATAIGVYELAQLIAILPNPVDYTPQSFWNHPDLRARWQFLWQRFGNAPLPVTARPREMPGHQAPVAARGPAERQAAETVAREERTNSRSPPRAPAADTREPDLKPEKTGTTGGEKTDTTGPLRDDALPLERN